MNVSKTAAFSATENFYQYHKNKVLALPSYADATPAQRNQIVAHEKAIKIYLEAQQKFL